MCFDCMMSGHCKPCPALSALRLTMLLCTVQAACAERTCPRLRAAGRTCLCPRSGAIGSAAPHMSTSHTSLSTSCTGRSAFLPLCLQSTCHANEMRQLQHWQMPCSCAELDKLLIRMACALWMLQLLHVSVSPPSMLEGASALFRQCS